MPINEDSGKSTSSSNLTSSDHKQATVSSENKLDPASFLAELMKKRTELKHVNLKSTNETEKQAEQPESSPTDIEKKEINPPTAIDCSNLTSSDPKPTTES